MSLGSNRVTWRRRGTLSKYWTAFLVCCCFSYEQITSQFQRTKSSTEDFEDSGKSFRMLDKSWNRTVTWWWHITHHSRRFIFSLVFSSLEHFPCWRSYSRRYCLGATQLWSCLKCYLKLCGKIELFTRVQSSLLSECPSLGLCATQPWFAKLPWNTPAEKAFSLPHKEDGPWRAGQLEREAVSHGRRDAGSGKEAPQLPLKRFLVNANNISGAKCNEGKCSDLVAQLAWMEIE